MRTALTAPTSTLGFLAAFAIGCSSSAAAESPSDSAPLDAREGIDAAAEAADTALEAPAEASVDAAPDAGPDVAKDANACTNACTAGANRCAPGGVETCATQANGCADWGVAVACATGRVCSSDACQTVTAISAGSEFSCALLSDKTVRCWGLDNMGQLGDGGGMNRKVPVAVPGVANIGSLSAGRTHACAAQMDGSVRCWGDNVNGAVGAAPLGGRLAPTTVSGLTDTVLVAAGDGSSCVRRTGGRMSCWGRHQVLGNAATADTATPTLVSGISQVVDVTTGGSFACELDANLRVYCWGTAGYGQSGDGSTVTLARDYPVRVAGLTWMGSDGGSSPIVAADYHACSMVVDGGPHASVMCWGRNDRGQIGDGTNSNALSATLVPALAGKVSTISAGGSHSCAVLSDGTVECWGRNLDGELGSGPSAPGDSSTPVAVNGLGPALDVAAGAAHTCALLQDHTVWCWGANDLGQLGTSTNTISRVPVAVVWQ